MAAISYRHLTGDAQIDLQCVLDAFLPVFETACSLGPDDILHEFVVAKDYTVALDLVYRRTFETGTVKVPLGVKREQFTRLLGELCRLVTRCRDSNHPGFARTFAIDYLRFFVNDAILCFGDSFVSNLFARQETLREEKLLNFIRNHA